MNYIGILEKNYTEELLQDNELSKLEFLSENLFKFTTYDGEKSELFAQKAIEVCLSISSRKTFEYIGESDKNYTWYLLILNMPFFSDKLEWGTSIRGVWWDHNITLNNYLFLVESISFNKEEWINFINSVAVWAMTKG